MNTFEVKIWDDEGRLCTFYTVQMVDGTENETDKFFSKYENETQFEEDLQKLLSFVIYSIGDDHGAVNELFNRFENEVIGLPVQGRVSFGEVTYYFPNFPLRLYALKITDEIVVLFNGGIKDGSTNQTSSLNLQWIEACQFARKILNAINDKDILIDEQNRRLTNHLGGNQIIL